MSLSKYINLLVLIANATFVLPFIIFASIAGQIADKYERANLIKIIKICEIGIIAFAIYGFHHNNLLILFCSICLMGIHSTFFGPIKYSVLPDHQIKTNYLELTALLKPELLSVFLSVL